MLLIKAGEFVAPTSMREKLRKKRNMLLCVNTTLMSFGEQLLSTGRAKIFGEV